MPVEKKPEDDDKPKFGARVKSWFSLHKEYDRYDRGLLDRRLERYLDKNFDKYIDEYGLVRELELKKYDEQYDDLVVRVSGLNDFMKDADADITDFERRTDAVKAAATTAVKK